MNFLGIDYGKKRIGLAVAVKGIITPLAVIPNDTNIIPQLKLIIDTYQIDKLYIGVSEGQIAKDTLRFVSRLKPVLELPVETVEEAVTTIEADEIYIGNKKKKKDYKKNIDSIAAAVILRRALG